MQLPGMFLAILLAASTPAWGDSPTVRCVQEQLAAAGYDPGAVDGLAGGRTRRALDAYRADNTGLPDRRLDADTAVVWCRLLGLRDDRLRAYWPSNGRPMRYVLGDTITQPFKPLLLGTAESVRQELVGRTGIELANRITLVAASSLPELEAAIKRHMGWRSIPPTIANLTRNACDVPDGFGGFAMASLVAICRNGEIHPSPTMRPDRFRQFQTALAHEFFHAVQLQLLGSPQDSASDRQRLAADGPLWLVEGSADLFAGLFLGHTEESFRDWAKESVGGDAPGLASLELMADRDRRYHEVYVVGRLAAADLAAQGGLEGVIRFYDLTGRSGDWRAAFAEAFGISVRDYYGSFSVN